MKHVTRRRIAIALTLGVGLALWASAIEAQSRTAPRSPMLIRNQIEKSLSLQREATASLGDPDRAVKLVYESYGQMRAAHSSMVVNASSMKYKDPLFPATDERVQRARGLILRAHVALRDREHWNGKGNPIDVARETLLESIRLTQTILATTF